MRFSEADKVVIFAPPGPEQVRSLLECEHYSNLSKRARSVQFSADRNRMTTYRYFLEPSVCLCRATENPKKLPLVFPSLITGNRSSILNPVHVCVPWYTAKTAQTKSLSDMFWLFMLLSCSGLSADPRSAWDPALSSNR